MTPNTRKSWFLTGLLTLLALSATALFYWSDRSDAVPTDPGDTPLIRVTRRSFSVNVRSVGILDAGQAHMVVSTLKGGKGKIIHLIQDGAWVKKGDVLVTLDPAPFEEEIQNLEGDVKRLQAAVEAKAQLFEWEKNQVTKALGTAEFKVRQARLALATFQEGEGPLKLIQYREELENIAKEKRRYQRYLTDLTALSDKGFDHPGEVARAKQELDRISEQHDTAQKKVERFEHHLFPAMVEKLESDIEQAQLELEQTKKGGVHQIAQAKSALDEMTAALDNHIKKLADARKKLDQTRITAPSDGIVILYETYREGQKRKPRIGDKVLQNQPILYLPDISTMVVKTRVREVDLHKVGMDKNCEVRVAAYPDKQLKGRIAFIGALATETGSSGHGAKYFDMTVKLTSRDDDLRPGMTARVNILADQVSDVLTLPVHAVFQQENRQVCYQYNNGGFKAVPVITGRENEDLIEIVSGLQEGDPVSMTLPETMESL